MQTFMYMYHYFLFHKAAQMWNLAIYLPLIIGDTVPPDDAKWECFLILLDILQLCTTRITTTGHAGILEALIHKHHTAFICCFPHASIIPKMHYMVHLPQQIVRLENFVAQCYIYVTLCVVSPCHNFHISRLFLLALDHC